MSVFPPTFRKQFATQSERSTGASATANANVPAELLGQHGDWKTLEAQRLYMKSDTEHLLSESWAAMGLPKTPTPTVRFEVESAGALPEIAEEGLPPDVVGVPDGAFT